MEIYRHSQTGRMIYIIAGAVSLLMLYRIDTGDVSTATGWIVIGLVIFITYYFGRLTVVLDHNKVRFYFGPGIIGKTILLDSVASVSQMNIPARTGWGVRRIKGGWIYNAGGSKGVRFDLKNGKVYAVSSDEPERLFAAIHQAKDMHAASGRWTFEGGIKSDGF